jgi:hypothetical protein
MDSCCPVYQGYKYYLGEMGGWKGCRGSNAASCSLGETEEFQARTWDIV